MVAPPAPWDLVASTLLWFGPAPGAAKGAVQPGVRGRPVGVAGALVRYAETPVGPYSEIMGQCALLRGATVVGHVPFIAVDSPESVEGGNANWALPKTLASFEGDPATDRAMHAWTDEWDVRATARALGPPLPLGGPFAIVQARDGAELHSSGRGRMHARPALVRVRVRGPQELTRWLRGGVYPGLIAERFEATLDAPAAAR